MKHNPMPAAAITVQDLTPSKGYQRLLHCQDSSTGLEALISIHSTQRGPAAGGCRLWAYPDLNAAIHDVERLSRGMTYKNAAADLPLGGGKSVILAHPEHPKSPALMRAFGRFVNTLEGQYYTAEDVGISPADMAHAAELSPYVAGLANGPFASGDPSPVTARGVFLCLKTAARHRFGSDDLTGKRIALQGLGHVGFALAEMLHAAGAHLTVCDLNSATLAQARSQLNAEISEPDQIFDTKCDIFAPCALGGALTPGTIARLNADLITGAAQNQLTTPDCGALLQARGITYAPDYVVNGGGIINVAMEILQITDPTWAERRILGLADTLDTILTKAATAGIPPHIAADQMVESRLNLVE
jgi:leucine dehydrogenase